MQTYPIQRITWLDSTSRNSWDTTEMYLERAAKMDLTVISVGYVVFESDDRVCLVMNLAPDAMDMMMTIPKCSITERITLDEA